MDCPKCNREIKLKEKTNIVKLPNILIFTLERYQGSSNFVKIRPDDILHMDQYIDESLNEDETDYELISINIRFCRNANSGHEICQVKRGNIWYEINDSWRHPINNPSHFDSSYGLFYRKKTNKNNINKSKKSTNIDNNEEYESLNTLKYAFVIISSFEELITFLKKRNYQIILYQK